MEIITHTFYQPIIYSTFIFINYEYITVLMIIEKR
jgi:hypothetical protein